MPYIGKDIESITFNSANNLNVVGNITLSGTVDSRDVAADGTKLDTVATNAIANLSEDTTPQLGGNLDLNTNNVIGTGNINVTGSITGTSYVSTGDMAFTNNSKAKFGTSPSLEIFHDGSNSILNDVGAGNFKMQLAGSDKLEVTSTGVSVTGVVAATSYTGSGANLTGINTDLVSDTTPQLGGALDVQTHSIVSTSNRDITIDPNGTGDIVLDANVGIGTASPDSNHKLEVASGGTAEAGIRSGNSSEAIVNFGRTNDRLRGRIAYNNSSEYMAFWTNQGEKMRLDSSGNLLVGTSSYDGSHFNDTSGGGFAVTSAGKIDMKVDGTVANFNSTNSSDGDILYFAKQGAAVGSIGTYGGDLAIGTGDTGLRFIDGSNAIAPSNIGSNTDVDASIDLGYASRRFKDGFFSNAVKGRYFQNNDDTDTYIDFATGNLINFYTAGSQRMMLSSNGAIRIGQSTTDVPGSGNTTSGISLRGHIGDVFFSRSGGDAAYFNTNSAGSSVVTFSLSGVGKGNVAVSSAGVTFNTTSDIRLKENIEPLEATDKLMQMNPVSYNWKADPSGLRSMGFIAQEMQEVMPEAVTTRNDEEALMSMDYGRITPILVSALQDAHRKIEQLEQRLAEMEAK